MSLHHHLGTYFYQTFLHILNQAKVVDVLTNKMQPAFNFMELTAQQRHKRSKGTIAELFDEDWHQHVPPACRRRAATLGLISCRGFVQGGIFKTGEKIYREVRKEKGWVEELVSTGQDFTLCLYLPG